MKKTKTCPKCSSRDVLYVQGKAGGYNNLILGLTVFSGLPVDHYVCADCGYTEEWINEDDLHYVKKELQKQRNTSDFWK